jgi:hypothetical protein
MWEVCEIWGMWVMGDALSASSQRKTCNMRHFASVICGCHALLEIREKKGNGKIKENRGEKPSEVA